MATSTIPVDAELADFIGQFGQDPLGFVRAAYPWGEAGTVLENETGPDALQVEFLVSLGHEVKKRGFDGSKSVPPIRMAESSGHGTGKSAMGAWIADWILSTRPYSIGTVTAGTATQLDERTWAAICHWTRLSITAHWFEVMATGIYSRVSPDNWKLIVQVAKAENAQAFAGQHAKGSTSWFLFDEASIVPDEIWNVAMGGIIGDEDMFFCWGQPVRNNGKFYEICFGRERDRWNHRTVDSRDSRFTNKDLIAEWLRDYGEQSDWCKVRIFGLPPTASELQYIDGARIEAAAARNVAVLDDEPLVAGFDVSGGGSAWNVIRFRRGSDARSIPPIRITGENGRDRNVLIGACSEVLRNGAGGHPIAAMFVDAAFGSPIVERLHVLGFKQVHEVNFGAKSIDLHAANMRAYMWSRAKEWLTKGAIRKDDERLQIDLAAPGYHINSSGKLVLESKEQLVKRVGHSPDDGDALALTFAQFVAPPAAPAPVRGFRRQEYAPFG